MTAATIRAADGHEVIGVLAGSLPTPITPHRLARVQAGATRGELPLLARRLLDTLPYDQAARVWTEAARAAHRYRRKEPAR
ncbi:hypothetical protein ABZ671_01315 [Micromonospora sp. NPDC006766]|uniref:hypothetical protein n=1 Tax=Micromonospora sp. NPDC006766 TaxID=3154778 RepID=UPI0033EEF711